MGTCKSRVLNKRAQQIWVFCHQFHIWITAFYIPGKENFEPDFVSKENIKIQSGCYNQKSLMKHKKLCRLSPR